MSIHKVAVIGNGGGGKTTLSLALADHHGLPVYEVDKLQYGPNWSVNPPEKTAAILQEAMAGERWLIDGFGPWDSIEQRFAQADTIYFVDFPFWQHCAWACERQISAAFGHQRLGGPDECDLRNISERMYQALCRVQDDIRPRLLDLAAAQEPKVAWIRSKEELSAALSELGWQKPDLLNSMCMKLAGEPGTTYFFRQSGHLVTVTCSGGRIQSGLLVGRLEGSSLELRGAHMTSDGDLVSVQYEGSIVRTAAGEIELRLEGEEPAVMEPVV